MQLLIIVLELLLGLLLGRAIAFVLTGMSVVILRRFVTLLFVVVCCGAITFAWYIQEAEIRHIVYAVVMSALIGFVVSQRTDRTVRFITCCVAVPLLIFASVLSIYITTTQMHVVDWDILTVPYPQQAALCAATPLALVVSLLWYIPAMSWKSRDQSIDGVWKALRTAVICCVCFAVTLAIYDRMLRHKIASFAADAVERETELYGQQPPDVENAVFAYQPIADALAVDEDSRSAFLDGLRDPTRVRETLEQHQSLLNDLKAASSHPGQIFLTLDMRGRSTEFLDIISSLAHGLVARARVSLTTDTTAALEDLTAVRRIQRHLATAPRLNAFTAISQLELRMRQPLELIERVDLESLYVQVPYDAPISNAYIDCKRQQFLAQVLKNDYLSRPMSSSFEGRSHRFLERLFWVDHDIHCIEQDTLAKLRMWVPNTIEGTQFYVEQNEIRRFQGYAAINDVGIFAREFYSQHGRAPTINELPTELHISQGAPPGTPTGESLEDVIAINELADGCVVSRAYEDLDLIQSMQDAEERLGAPPKSSQALYRFGRFRAERLFLVGAPLRRYRQSAASLGKTTDDAVILLAPTSDQTFAILSAIRRGEYSSVLADVRKSMDSKYRHTFHDPYDVLSSSLNVLCQLGVDDGPWFYSKGDMFVAHESGDDHRLTFLSLDDLSRRGRLLSKVRRDDFEDAFNQIHWDYGTPFDKASGIRTWNQLSELADFIETARTAGRPVLCITVD